MSAYVVKRNILEDLRSIETLLKSGVAPCSICRGVVMACCADTMLEVLKAEQRRARHIRRVKRVGNLMQFPKL
jgi:hypothetical protein